GDGSIVAFCHDRSSVFAMGAPGAARGAGGGTSALAGAYLYSDLSPDDFAAGEGAVIMVLDDSSPLVRRGVSEVVASCEQAPQAVGQALAADQPDVALPVLEHWRCCRKTTWLTLSRQGEPKHSLPSRSGAC